MNSVNTGASEATVFFILVVPLSQVQINSAVLCTRGS